MTKVTISAKNLDVALVKAAGALSISRSEVGHRIRNETQGFLGLGKKITIDAWRRKDKRVGGESFRKRRSAPQLSAEKTTAVIAELKQFLNEILVKGFGIHCEIVTKEDVSIEGRRIVFEVPSAEFRALLEQDLLLADAIEHLLRKLPRNIKRELPFKIFVDAGSLRSLREKQVVSHAKQVSDKVVKTGESLVLDYESSYDRKIIHLALQKDERVATKSIGQGARKKLKISPR